jgi:hypothetical protein
MNTLSNSMDIDRCCSAFLGQFYGKYRKFSFTNNFMILKFLFEACCTSFYGAELWYDMNTSDKQFKAFGVAYHKAIKRMKNLPPWESNHDTCEQAGLSIFKHFINKKIMLFWFSVIYSKSPCIAPLLDKINRLFFKQYNIVNLLDNDVDAIISRINFVETHEPRSHNMSMYQMQTLVLMILHRLEANDAAPCGCFCIF